MYLLILVFISLQIFISSSQSPDSALSCIMNTFNQAPSINTYRISSVYNKKKIKSVKSNVKFMFYSRDNPDGIEFTLDDENSLKKCKFNPKRPTKIVTHGYNGKGNHASCVGPTKAFLKTGDFNVFIMDWYKHQTDGFGIPIYWEVIKRLNEVGSHLADMINFLENNGLNMNTTTLIGHSLGAHVVGIAGYNTKSKVNHIVGLDPAEPFLENRVPGERISDQDAHHVEIIHTNSNHCGMFKPLGHYDFYPNGGIKQPGCKRNSCSHQRAPDYYTESIISLKGFHGTRCPDQNNVNKEYCNGEIAEMGGKSRNSISPGIYYLETNEKYPYAKGTTR